MKTIRRFFTLVLVPFFGLFSVGVLHAEASDIIIPEFSLDNVTLEDAVMSVIRKSVEVDPRKQGVNVIIKKGNAEVTKLTLKLKGQSVKSILRTIADLSGLELAQEKGAYVLKTRNESAAEVPLVCGPLNKVVLLPNQTRQAADIPGYAEKLIIPAIHLSGTPLNEAFRILVEKARNAVTDPDIHISMEVSLGRALTDREFDRADSGARSGPPITLNLENQSFATVLEKFAGQLGLKVKQRNGHYRIEP
jgi:hypothetical protein